MDTRHFDNPYLSRYKTVDNELIFESYRQSDFVEVSEGIPSPPTSWYLQLDRNRYWFVPITEVTQNGFSSYVSDPTSYSYLDSGQVTGTSTKPFVGAFRKYKTIQCDYFEESCVTSIVELYKLEMSYPLDNTTVTLLPYEGCSGQPGQPPPSREMFGSSCNFLR